MTRGEIGRQDSAVATTRRNRPGAIGHAVDLAAKGFDRAGFNDATLVLRWREIVGPEIARLAEPLKLSEGPAGGILTLKAEPAAAVFLQHETRSLCERINAYLGRPAVARLRFVKGTIAAPARPARQREFLPDSAQNDPANAFSGPDRLKAALIGLARARRRPTRD